MAEFFSEFLSSSEITHINKVKQQIVQNLLLH